MARIIQSPVGKSADMVQDGIAKACEGSPESESPTARPIEQQSVDVKVRGANVFLSARGVRHSVGVAAVE